MLPKITQAENLARIHHVRLSISHEKRNHARILQKSCETSRRVKRLTVSLFFFHFLTVMRRWLACSTWWTTWWTSTAKSWSRASTTTSCRWLKRSALSRRTLTLIGTSSAATSDVTSWSTETTRFVYRWEILVIIFYPWLFEIKE